MKYHSYLKPIHLSFNFIPISQFTIHLVNALLNGLQNHSESIILSNIDFNGNLHHELIKDLNLIVGLNKIARYNCCLHKANGPAKITIKEKDSYNRFTT